MRRTEMRRVRGFAAWTSALVVTGLALLVPTPAGSVELTGRGSSTTGNPAAIVSMPPGGGHAPGFAISGSVAGLFPGEVKVLVLRVANPQRFSITVTSLSVKVTSSVQPCAATNLSVGGFTGSLVVPAGSSAAVAVPVAMTRAAPDGCQGATFVLTYVGLAHET